MLIYINLRTLVVTNTRHHNISTTHVNKYTSRPKYLSFHNDKEQSGYNNLREKQTHLSQTILVCVLHT